jgi:N4-(beta-N-acetylglucosaminyl)-L-asparaginase
MTQASRRSFLKQSALIGAGALAARSVGQGMPVAGTVSRPVVVASANGLRAVTRAMEMISGGSDALDAVIAGVNIVEDDPNDVTVGYGGLPNEDGVVELDAAVMHGPTHRGGAVAALQNIKNPSKVARMVMERTDHVLLVAEGALRFARAHGFPEENLLTDQARSRWLEWKEKLSPKDDWLPPHTEFDEGIGDLFEPFFRSTGTIHCAAVDLKGNVSCVTTTSGLAFKIAGRVGDSPILGAGLWVDNDVGAAGSTGRGEANLINSSSVMIVEWMRQGKSPEEACLEGCRRVVNHNKMRRLKNPDGRPSFNIHFYALNKEGTFGSAGLYAGGSFAVHDGTSARLLSAASLYREKLGG